MPSRELAPRSPFSQVDHSFSPYVFMKHPTLPDASVTLLGASGLVAIANGIGD